MAQLADTYVPIACLDLKGYLESKSFLGEIGGRVIVRMSLLVPRGESNQRYEIIAYDQEARFCLDVEEDEPLFVIVVRPTTSELKDPIQHTGMVALDVDWWWPDEEERGF